MNTSPVLPEPLQARFDELLDALRPLVPERAAAIVLYGGLAKGKAFTASSDVNLLVVTAGPALAALQALAAPLVRGRRELRVNPLVASPEDLAAMARDFPLKYEDIRRRHVLLLGADPFGAGASAPADLRRDARSNLSNLSLRLKRAYVERSADPGLHLAALEDLLSSALLAFEAALGSAGLGEVGHREDTLAAAAAKAGTRKELLLGLLAVKKGSAAGTDADLAAMHGELLTTVENLRRSLETA